ncbi:hypothetical protein KUM39_03145 [Streptomyces sp. J2-1]|uniref:hypothetical protein n=1 Tax=Streptomyces corallincola TaxID=2851888 RepID=UPI001C3865CB|nr:hypothetical protein [Streptomyces corallincola]MBV2353365.1 hypothetical protein [Streptomyces corallincola]
MAATQSGGAGGPFAAWAGGGAGERAPVPDGGTRCEGLDEPTLAPPRDAEPGPGSAALPFVRLGAEPRPAPGAAAGLLPVVRAAGPARALLGSWRT